MQRLRAAEARCDAVERRRRLEAEGYQASVTMLQDKLRATEKQLYRLALREVAAVGGAEARMAEAATRAAAPGRAARDPVAAARALAQTLNRTGPV